MNLSLNLNEKYNLPLYQNLCNLKRDELFGSSHNPPLGNPADIFSSQFSKVLYSAKKLIPYLDNSVTDTQEFQKNITSYFYDLDSFHDNLYGIIKCLKEPQKQSVPDAMQWLKENNHKEGILLSDAISKMHSRISNIANKMKHGERQIVPFSLTWNGSYNKKIHGFFVGFSDDDGLISPDPDIHKNYKKLSTAFSFNHFLLSTIGQIYNYSYRLNIILFKNKKSFSDGKQMQFYDLAEIALRLEPVFFPDEYTKDYAKFIRNSQKIMIEFPIKSPKTKPRESWTSHAWIAVNQRTKVGKGKIPYWGESSS